MIHKHEYEQQIECNSCTTCSDKFELSDFGIMIKEWKQSGGILILVSVTTNTGTKQVWKHFCQFCRELAEAHYFYPTDEGKTTNDKN
jgi:hypothetical protein